LKTLILLIIAVNSLFAVDAQLDIIRKNSNIPKLTVLISGDTNSIKLAQKVKILLEKDLTISGHFNVKSTKYKLKSIDSNVDYFDNLVFNNDLMLILEMKKQKKDNFIVRIKLHDINKKDIIMDKIYTIANKNRYPFLSHKIAININDTLNAPSIKWMDRFVIFARYTGPKKSEIIVADYTLNYQKIAVKGGLNIFPKWADKEQNSFYYTSYDTNFPTLIKQNLYTSESKEILSSLGMMVCSDVSYDSDNIIVTMAPQGQPDIYIYNTKTKLKTRMTTYTGIDVSGSFVDNDTKIIFVSDRLGKANIFAKKIDGKGVERMVYHGRNNSQASTFKNYIVYSSREIKNEFGVHTFNLYLISTRNDTIRQLTINGGNKFPKFSLDGESILFTKSYKEKSYLGILRLNLNKSFLFKLKSGKIQSIDW
jgi:TolB protein